MLAAVRLGFENRRTTKIAIFSPEGEVPSTVFVV
jgi:hypothetical protein